MLPPRPRRIAVALGSNLGNRDAALDFATARLSLFLSDVQASSRVETEPAGPGLGDQPLYLNAAIVGRTALPVRDILDALLSIERDYGRERPYPGAPRTLDLDLILAGDEVAAEPGLRVPHPRFRERFFVLGPLAEVAGEMRDPVSGLTVGELLKRLLADERR